MTKTTFKVHELASGSATRLELACMREPEIPYLTAEAEKEARQFLAALREEIRSHAGVGHSILGRMKTDPRTRFDFMVLAGQHFPLVGNFTRYMELLLLRAPSSEAKCWLAKVLVDEYGERSEGQDHSEHYRKFMHAAGHADGEEDNVKLHPEVVHFIREHYRICIEEPFLVGLGALGPGHEWSIPAMFELAVAGLRKAGFAENEIEYWTMHMDQDQDHGAWLEEALVNYCATDEQRAQIRRGALLSLDARERFWWGVTDKITSGATTKNLPPGAGATNETGQLTLRELRKQWRIEPTLIEDSHHGG
ncbi:MAG: iron-containing redox enzyme family protein [Planctomycetes bacterium]|nr:iron-containing redox enzyme family protein [Planctomycetota bacterium]